MNVLEKFLTNGLRDKSEATIKTYGHGLRQFSVYLAGGKEKANEIIKDELIAKLESFTRSDVQRYMNHLANQKQSAAVIHKAYSAIVKFAKWAKRLEVIEEIRVKKSAIKVTKSKAIDEDGIEELVDNFEHGRKKTGKKRMYNKERNFAILQVLLNTGMRVSELVGLDRDDIVMSERKGIVRIRNGKGFKERIVPLDPETRRAIRKYLETRSDDNPALFISNEKKRISVRSVQTLFENQGYNVHQFRHTFVTELMRDNVPINKIQGFTGHESADMILRYSRPTLEDLEEVLEKRKAFR